MCGGRGHAAEGGGLGVRPPQNRLALLKKVDMSFPNARGTERRLRRSEDSGLALGAVDLWARPAKLRCSI